MDSLLVEVVHDKSGSVRTSIVIFQNSVGPHIQDGDGIKNLLQLPNSIQIAIHDPIAIHDDKPRLTILPKP